MEINPCFSDALDVGDLLMLGRGCTCRSLFGYNLALGTFRKKTCSEHVKPAARGRKASAM